MIIWIGYNNERLNETMFSSRSDKIWGIAEYFGDFIAFYGKRNCKKLQTKKYSKDEVQKLINSKRRKGYKELLPHEYQRYFAEDYNNFISFALFSNMFKDE